MYTLETANHEKTIKKAVLALNKYFNVSDGDNISRMFQGTIHWSDRQALDYLFSHCAPNTSGINTYCTDDWAISFTTGSYVNNQNKVRICWFISAKRSVNDMLIEAGFTTQETEFLIDQYQDNLDGLGVLLEAKLVTVDSIAF